jgi:hypothetical protein
MNELMVDALNRGDWIAPLAGLSVRWFPAEWNLQERKKRKRFQAVLYHIPESLKTAALIPNFQLHPLIYNNKIKAFKIVQTADK